MIKRGDIIFIENQFFEIKINKGNVQWFRDMAYMCDLRDIVLVRAEDITKGSHIRVKISCDYCITPYEVEYKAYLRDKEKSLIKKDCCINCRKLKAIDSTNIFRGEEKGKRRKRNKSAKIKTELEKKKSKEKKVKTNLERFGVEWFTQTEKYKNGFIQYSLDNFGATNPMKNETIKDRLYETIKEKYDVGNVMHLEWVREKTINTWIDNYGVDHPSKSELVREKRANTNLERHGFRSVMSSPLVQQKSKNTQFQNGTTRTSQQQLYIYHIIGGELNYPVGRCNLDIAFPEEMIYVEYDGGGHDIPVKSGQMSLKDFEHKERKRDLYLKSLGWKRIRMISPNDMIPEKEEIRNIMSEAREYLSLHSQFKVYFEPNNGFTLKKINYKKGDL